jgi:amino acid transporter
VFVGAGVFFIDPSAFSGAAPPEVGSFSQALILAVFAFAGFEATVIAAGEIQDPRRNLPFALLVSLVTAGVLYMTIQTVCIGTLPALAASERPLADAAVRFMGVAGGSMVTVGALISTIGTLLGILLVGPRLLFAMAEQNQIPRWFARTHPRFHTPHVAILLTAGLGLALSISGTFTYLVGLNVVARLVAYMTTAAALLAFRRREGDQPARFRLPAAGLVVAVTFAASLWLLWMSGRRELRDAGIAVAVGLAVHALDRWRRARVAPTASTRGDR